MSEQSQHQQAQRGQRPQQGAVGQATDQAGQVLQQAQDTAGQTADQAQGAVGGLASGSGEQPTENYSHSDSDTTTAENDKSPKGPLAQLLNLEILQSPNSDSTTLESGDSGEYQGPGDGDQQGETQG